MEPDSSLGTWRWMENDEMMQRKFWLGLRKKKICEGGQTLNQVTQKARKISVSGDTQNLTRQGPEQADPTLKRALGGEKRRG